MSEDSSIYDSPKNMSKEDYIKYLTERCEPILQAIAFIEAREGFLPSVRHLWEHGAVLDIYGDDDAQWWLLDDLKDLEKAGLICIHISNGKSVYSVVSMPDWRNRAR